MFDAHIKASESHVNDCSSMPAPKPLIFAPFRSPCQDAKDDFCDLDFSPATNISTWMITSETEIAHVDRSVTGTDSTLAKSLNAPVQRCCWWCALAIQWSQRFLIQSRGVQYPH